MLDICKFILNHYFVFNSAGWYTDENGREYVFVEGDKDRMTSEFILNELMDMCKDKGFDYDDHINLFNRVYIYPDSKKGIKKNKVNIE